MVAPRTDEGAEQPRSPTLLVAVGAFGARVAALALGQRDARVANLARLDVPAEAPPGVAPAAEAEALAAAAREKLRAMLDLAHYVRSTPETDARGPHCDVLVVCDLAEGASATRVAPACAAIASALRTEFSTIFRGRTSSLFVCPLLAAPRAGPRAAMAAAARALEKLAAGEPQARTRLGARIFVVEDQSEKYVLSEAEIARQFAAFLQLLLFSSLRDEEASLRPLVEASTATGHRAGPFATFACATLELDLPMLRRFFTTRLARRVLAHFRDGGLPSINEIAAEATPLVPDRARLETLLWEERSASMLEKHLAPPAIDVPEIAWNDTPEDIVERKVGPLWRADAVLRMRQFRDEVERFKMARLAGEIERNGHRVSDDASHALVAYADKTVARGPRGHARALEVLRDARARAAGHLGEIAAALQAPNLPEFPSPPLDAGVRKIEEAAFQRPRPFRLAALGAVSAFVAWLAIAGVLFVVQRVVRANDGWAWSDPRRLDGATFESMLRDGALPLGVGLALAASWVGYRLWKHRRRHHVWVREARDELDQALKRHLAVDVVGYFYERLHFARLLWVQRVYQRLVRELDAAVAHLELVRASLALADAELARAELGLERELDARSGSGGVLLRGMLGAADARATYEELAPVSVADVAKHLSAKTAAAWRAAPFADLPVLAAHCDGELAHLDKLDPYQADGSRALAAAALRATRAFLGELSMKLALPLELSARGALEPPAVAERVFAPEQAREAVAKLLDDANLRGRWRVDASRGVSRRVHLLIEQRDLAADAVALLAGSQADLAP